MTHFVTAVIVPKAIYNKGEEATAKFIDGLMWPYCEEYKVTPYIEETKEEIEQKFAEWKQELQEKLDKGEKIEDYYKKYVSGGKVKPVAIKKWVKDWSGKDMDDKGNVITTWNQNSFWDWYRIGGRWDGLITENSQSSEDGFNFDSKHETVENNSMQIEVLLEKLKARIKQNEKSREVIDEIIGSIKSPFGGFGFADIIREFVGKGEKADLEAKEKELYEKIEKRFIEQLEKFEIWNPYVIHKILDSKGRLYDGRRYGWFGISEDKQEPGEWLKIYTKLLEDNKYDYLVTLDCHV